MDIFPSKLFDWNSLLIYWFDSIEDGAKVHGMSDEEIDEMVERINEVIEFDE